jgi:hypothetical protein
MHAIVMHSTQPWPANARASIDAAAARWHCHVRVFDFAYAPHPSWARLELAKDLQEFDRVMVVDPDIFISEDCPNLLSLAPPLMVCMTPELQALEDRVGPYPWAGALAQWRNVLGRRVRPDKHLQGGVCIYEPRTHARTFERMLGWWNMHGRFSFAPVYEQPLWHEVGERLFDLPVRRMSRLVNRHTRVHSETPQHYVMHLTGTDKHARIARTTWRGRAEEPAVILAHACELAPSWRDALTPVLHAAMFHERILIIGDALEPAACVAAHVTAGTVRWLRSTRCSIPAWASGEATGRLHIVTGATDSLVRKHQITLLVAADRDGVPIVTPLHTPPPQTGSTAHWWRNLHEPSTPLGSLRRRAMQLLRPR